MAGALNSFIPATDTGIVASPAMYSLNDFTTDHLASYCEYAWSGDHSIADSATIPESPGLATTSHIAANAMNSPPLITGHYLESSESQPITTMQKGSKRPTMLLPREGTDSDTGYSKLNSHGKQCRKCRVSSEQVQIFRAERRREQNRNSQRKFRAKKDERLRQATGQAADLDKKLYQLTQLNHELEAKNTELNSRVILLEYKMNLAEFQLGQSVPDDGPSYSTTVTTLCREMTTGGVTQIYLGKDMPLFDHELALPPANLHTVEPL